MISIIDDDESVRSATRSLVRSLGFTAFTFDSAEQFLSSALMDETSCVISDMRMPTMSGVEMQRRLLTQGRRIPIIFITAFPDEGAEARVMSAGAVAFLSKPFDGGTLIKCIEAALNRRDRENSEG